MCPSLFAAIRVWSRGRIVASHATDPGSSPGTRTFLVDAALLGGRGVAALTRAAPTRATLTPANARASTFGQGLTLPLEVAFRCDDNFSYAFLRACATAELCFRPSLYEFSHWFAHKLASYYQHGLDTPAYLNALCALKFVLEKEYTSGERDAAAVGGQQKPHTIAQAIVQLEHCRDVAQMRSEAAAGAQGSNTEAPATLLAAGAAPLPASAVVTAATAAEFLLSVASGKRQAMSARTKPTSERANERAWRDARASCPHPPGRRPCARPPQSPHQPRPPQARQRQAAEASSRFFF